MLQQMLMLNRAWIEPASMYSVYLLWKVVTIVEVLLDSRPDNVIVVLQYLHIIISDMLENHNVLTYMPSFQNDKPNSNDNDSTG